MRARAEEAAGDPLELRTALLRHTTASEIIRGRQDLDPLEIEVHERRFGQGASRRGDVARAK